MYLKRIILLLLVFIAGNSCLSAGRLLGTMFIAYGTPGKDAVTEYYVYSVYSNGQSVSGETLLAGLKAETRELEYKRYKFYPVMEDYQAKPLFEKTLTRKEKKKARGQAGGTCNEDGGIYYANKIYTPRHPQDAVEYTEAFRNNHSEIEAPPQRSSWGGDPNKKLVKVQCKYCKGAGKIHYEKLAVGGGTSYSSTDQYGRKTYSTSSGTGSVTCTGCNGTGEVEVEVER